MATLLLSDLHLPADISPLRGAFLRFLDGPARRAQAVYILGDLFETWIGDDVGLALYPKEVAALRRLSDSGVALYLQHGNRDFMLGADFAAIAGAQLLPDPSVVSIDGERVLLSHGDAWCTDDRDYQRWRRISRLRWLQWLFLRLPQQRRMGFAQSLRARSDDARQTKALDITDVNPRAVTQGLERSGTRLLIHGHTHRPAEHRMQTAAGTATRLVLPDWRPGKYAWVALSAAPEGGLNIFHHAL